MESLKIPKEFFLQEFSIGPSEDPIAWHSALLTSPGNPKGAGFSKSREIARKIAFAEYIERSEFERYKSSDKKVLESWSLDTLTTACGFAVGFDKTNTQLRSIGEGLERWVLSKFIDEGCAMDNFDLTKHQGNENVKIRSELLNIFQSSFAFTKTFPILFENEIIMFTITLFAGLYENGIYQGSSSSTGTQPNIEHAIVEALRHKLLVANSKLLKSKFPDERILFFSENRNIGLNAIDLERKKKNWGVPNIAFHRISETTEYNAFIARTVFEGWTPWNEGPASRFLY